MEKLFAALVVYHHNFKMLHWKCVGKDFDMTHRMCDEYASKLATFIDEVAEIMIMYSAKPLCLQCCLELIRDDESHQYLLIDHNTEEFDSNSILEYVDVMFNSLNTLYSDLCNAEISEAAKSKLQEHQYYIMLENIYKNKQRRS